MNKSNRNKMLLSTIITVAIVTLSVNFLRPKGLSESSIKKELEQYNKNLPSPIDEFSWLDSITMSTFKVLDYHVTVNVLKDEVNFDSVEKNVLPHILDNIKTNPSLKELRKSNFTWNYIFNDKDGVIFHEYKITPEMYAN